MFVIFLPALLSERASGWVGAWVGGWAGGQKQMYMSQATCMQLPLSMTMSVCLLFLWVVGHEC